MMTGQAALTATHVAGPLWTIQGQPLTVPAGVDARDLVTRKLAELADGRTGLPVLIRQAGQVTHLVVRADGTVVPVPDRPTSTVLGEGAAKPVPSPQPEGFVLVSGHPGSGASTWAQLLGVPEVAPGEEGDRPVLIVVRSTVAGVEAAKPWTTTAAGVLMVADAPGKVPPMVARAIRVLTGAAPVIRVPWVPALRGVTEIPTGDGTTKTMTKTVAKVAAAIEKDRSR